MNSKWFDCTLDDVLEFKNGKSLSNSCYIETGEYPVWGSNGMIAHCEKPLNFEPVIVIGRVGAYCGSINLVTESNWVTDNAIYATAKDGNDLKFLYYLLISLDIPHTAIGSAQPLLTQSGLRVLKCKVPPLETQREIAHILGTLDDKIELNRKMNKTLEEIAQTLYKHWFIDFEFPNAEGKPYKSSGGEMVDSELGLIPKGWRVDKLKECCIIVQNGGTPNTSVNDYWTPATIPWLTSGEVRQSIIIETLKMISESGLNNSSAKWTPQGSTVVALYGATAGQIALVAAELTTNQAICSLIPKESYTYYIFMTLLHNQVELTMQARGSAQQNLSKELVESLSAAIPDCLTIKLFHGMISVVYAKVVGNLIENLQLSKLSVHQSNYSFA